MLPETVATETTLAPADDQDVVQYRAVCGVSIVAFLLGLASSAALLAPLLWFVPALGALVAWLALARLRARPAELTGRGLALAALALALFFGLWAPTQYYARQRILFHQADDFARQWFQLLRDGKQPEAYELHLASGSRQGANVLLDRYYAGSDDARKALQEFFSRTPLKELSAAGNQAEVTLRGYVAVSPDDELSTAQVLILDYDAQLPGNSKPLPMRLFLRRRQPESNHVALWEVVNLIDPAKKAGS